jgi:DNA polymerase-1
VVSTEPTSMKIIRTDQVAPEVASPQEREWVYNGLDCVITREVLDVLLPQLDNQTTGTYQFSRDLQAPILEMRCRGVLIDQARRAEVIDEYFTKLDQLEEQLNRIVGHGLGLWQFNWRSNKDLHLLFYDHLGLPPIRRGGRPTVNREALEKLESYFSARLIVAHMLVMRDMQKKISMLKTEIDPDGRMRTSYNIAGTTTGRLSSSFSEFGTGTNLQNIEEALRSVFVADPGYKLAYLDAEQGESRVVGAIEGNLFDDWRYLDACEGGDLHTTVARLVWPDVVAWTGNLAGDRQLAEQPYYRHYDRRFMCKKIGHGTNYGGKPRTLAAQAKVEVGLIEDFQPKYFRAFPAHLRWHARVDRTLREDGHLTTLTGRKRWFFGRRNDDSTLREAIAYDPQGSLADILNRGMLSVWRSGDCQLLLQIHDAILVQYKEEKEDKIIPKIQEQLKVPIQLDNGREFLIPYGVQTGFNWGKYDEKDNPEGLKSYRGGDTRKRRAPIPILERPLSRAFKGSA